MRAPLKKVIMAKYVSILEIMGYVVAGIMLALWGVFFLIKIDQNCFGSGVANPAILELAIPQQAVLEKTSVPDGTWVKKDQVIFQLNLNKKAIAARQAQVDLASLGTQVLTLADDPAKKSELQQDVAQLVREVGALATGREEKQLTAPEDGLFKMTAKITSSPLATAAEGSPGVVEGSLGQVISSKVMQAEIDLGDLNLAGVQVDKPANITIRLQQEKKENLLKGLVNRTLILFGVREDKDKVKLAGKVIKMPAPKKAIVEARVTDEAISKKLAERISDPSKASEPLKTEVKVVVDKIRFIRLLIPKK